MMIGDKGQFQSAEAMATALADFLEIKMPEKTAKVASLAKDTFVQAQEASSIALQPGSSITTRAIGAIPSEATATLQAYLNAREGIPGHDPLAVLMYDLLNHNALPEEYRGNYRPIAVDLQNGNIAMGPAGNGGVFTFNKNEATSAEVLADALKSLLAVPPAPAKAQQIVAQVNAQQAQHVNSQQLLQALNTALTAVASFTVAMQGLRKANEKLAQSTTGKRTLEPPSQEAAKASKQSDEQKSEKKHPVVESRLAADLEKKKAQQLEKEIQQDRNAKFRARKETEAQDALRYEKKLKEERNISLQRNQ